MSVAIMQERATATPVAAQAVLRSAVLARLAVAADATPADVARDVAAMVPAVRQTEVRGWVKDIVAALIVEGLAVGGKGRVDLTEAGRAAAVAALGGKALAKTWVEIRDTRLVAQALGCLHLPQSRLATLAKPDGLRAAIVRSAYKLAIKGSSSPARLRAALSVVALERAFGNKVKSGLGSGEGLSAKAGRLLAGQLARKPRDFGTDSRLVAALAAEHLDVSGASVEALRTALLRRHFGSALPPPILRPRAELQARQLPLAMPEPAATQISRPAAATRPDLVGFARAVQQAAHQRAEGWPGNRKAFVSHVWLVLQARHPQWGLSAIEFKGMLAEAHRTGHVALASADLKDKERIKDFQESAIVYKNTVWHFVRVED